MVKAILAEPTAPRCQVAARRPWGMGARVWGVDGERRLLSISSTLGPRASQPSLIKVGTSDLPPHPRAAPPKCWHPGARAQSPDEGRTLGWRQRRRGPQSRAHRSVGWPEAPAQRHQPAAHGQRPDPERCGTQPDVPARSPRSDRACCAESGRGWRPPQRCVLLRCADGSGNGAGATG
jgi:hypothetical protein